MIPSKLYVLLVLYSEVSGPADPDGNHPGPDIVAAIGQRLYDSVSANDGADLHYSADGGDIGSDQLADAVQQVSSAPGRPLILLLTVGAAVVGGAGLDGTLLEYGPSGREAAQDLFASQLRAGVLATTLYIEA